MSTSIVKSAGSALAVSSFAEMKEMAKFAKESGLFKNCDTEAKTIALFMKADALSIPLGLAADICHVMTMGGKTTVAVDYKAALALFQRAGGRIQWLVHSADEAKAIFSHPLGGDNEVSFTMKDANTAGYPARNPQYKKHPKQMLQSKCVKMGVNMTYPACLLGISMKEDAKDVEVDMGMVDTVDSSEAKGASPELVKKLRSSKWFPLLPTDTQNSITIGASLSRLEEISNVGRDLLQTEKEEKVIDAEVKPAKEEPKKEDEPKKKVPKNATPKQIQGFKDSIEELGLTEYVDQSFMKRVNAENPEIRATEVSAAWKAADAMKKADESNAAMDSEGEE